MKIWAVSFETGVVAKQAELGVDVVDDGEHSKSNFAAYTGRRIGGFELTDKFFAVTTVSKDMLEFGPVYEENRAMCAAIDHGIIPFIRSSTRARATMMSVTVPSVIALPAASTRCRPSPRRRL